VPVNTIGVASNGQMGLTTTDGRFQTRGRNAAATVRGTTWRLQDRRDGTLTTVTKGVVAVRDFRLRRTVLVRAGQSYLARIGRSSASPELSS